MSATLLTRAGLWRDRLARFAMGGGVMVVGAVLGAVRNKWLAEHLSTSGVGVLAQVVAAQTWLATVAGLGLALPVARAVAAATAAGDVAAVRRALWTALGLAGAATLVLVGGGLAFAPWASGVLLGTDAHAGLVRISMIGALGLSLHVVVSGVFHGRSDVQGMMMVSLVGGLAAVATTFALVPRAGLAGGVIGAAVMAPVGLAAAVWARRRVHRDAFALPPPPFDPATARALLRVGVAALALAILDQGTLLGLRVHYLRLNGIPANGLLQAALSLSVNVSGMFMAYLAAYAFGRISRAPDPAGVRDYTRRHWTSLIALSALGCGLVMALSAPLLRLFYSDGFVPARPLMAWVLFAEFCRVTTQVWSLGAVPLGALGTWLAIGLAGPAASALAYALLAPLGGPLTLPHALAAGALAQLGLAGLLMGRRGVTLRAQDAAVLVAALAALGALASAIAARG
jgi:O-antigen/teichoic acid export membrane protein